MIGIGVSYGAISVINAIPCGIGSTIGVDLCTKVLFEPCDGPVRVEIVRGQDHLDDTLVRTCVRRVLERIGKDPSISYRLRIESDIPPSRGLKSSSSVCNATIGAVLDYYDVRMDTMEMIRLGVECAVECKVTITGAFDDACGCHLGGLVVTDNAERSLIARKELPKYDVLIFIPEKRITKDKVDVAKYREHREEFEQLAHSVEEDPLGVMYRNGKAVAGIIGMDDSLVNEAMAAGALAAGVSGTGPAVAAIFAPGTAAEAEKRFEHNMIRCRVR